MLDRLTIERMAAKAGKGPILIALSGGGDSVALLHLLVSELGANRLRAAVVDHALREGSADDARRAVEFAEALGVAAEVLTVDWSVSGPPAPSPASAGAGRRGAGGPDKRSQNDARRARYTTLCNHARTIDANVIAVAHTADDQAETVLMRAVAGSSWRGLAGMAPLAPAPLWPEGRGITLARPLLGVRRAALREELRRRDADWIEDPGNTNAAFERVRVRARLATLEAAGFDPVQLARIAARLRPRAEAIDRAAFELIANAARFEDERIMIARSDWRGDDEVRQRALSALIAAAAGAQREPASDAVVRLEGRLREESFSGASLGGTKLARVREAITLVRDRGALAGRADGAAGVAPLELTPGVETVWDGRALLRVSEPGWSVVVEGGEPVLARGEQRADLAAASPHWLLRTRVQHALGFA